MVIYHQSQFSEKEKSMAKKTVLAVIVALIVMGAANAQVTISGGLALSGAEIDTTNYQGETGIGGNIYLDYLLPIGIPLSLGVEFGVDTSSFNDQGWSDTATAIPLLLRAAYHFDLAAKLDLYVVGKIGYVFGDVSGDTINDANQSGYTVEVDGGIGFGFDVGAAYYFTPLVGVFAELGFDHYSGKFVLKTGNQVISSVDVTFNRFFTAGLSLKL
jgi:hypothetical protein